MEPLDVTVSPVEVKQQMSPTAHNQRADLGMETVYNQITLVFRTDHAHNLAFE